MTGTSANSAQVDPHGPFITAAIAMTAFAVVMILGFLAALKRDPNWSVADALSEEAGNQPTLPPGQKPVMVASASRTIALFGLFVIMAGVFGIAYFIVWALFYDRPLDGLDKITPFFYGSAAIFAPYAVNQMKEAFSSLGGASPPPAAPAIVQPVTTTTTNAPATPVQAVPIPLAQPRK